MVSTTDCVKHFGTKFLSFAKSVGMITDIGVYKTLDEVKGLFLEFFSGVSIRNGGELVVKYDMESWADESSFGIVNNGNIDCMLVRVSDVNAVIASFLPFGMGITVCKCWFEDKARRSTDVEILGPNRAVGHREGFVWTFFSGIGC